LPFSRVARLAGQPGDALLTFLLLPACLLPTFLPSAFLLSALALWGAPAALAQTPVQLPAQAPAAEAARPVQIIAAVRPPYVTEQGGTARGPAIDLLLLLAREAGLAPAIRVLPFQRALMALEQGGMLYPALLRTPQREGRFAWIGEVYVDRAVVFTRADAVPVGNVAAARALPRISVMRGSELQGMLQSFGLENFETANNETDNARLLQAGRIDGWFALRAVGRATWSELRFNPAELRAGEPFATLPFWIAGSTDLPADTLAALRSAYRAARADGRYRQLVAPLLALENPS
jgi:polar amino acid transport system substrate-binding protein